jgi:hypothetical protein
MPLGVPISSGGANWLGVPPGPTKTYKISAATFRFLALGPPRGMAAISDSTRGQVGARLQCIASSAVDVVAGRAGVFAFAPETQKPDISPWGLAKNQRDRATAGRGFRPLKEKILHRCHSAPENRLAHPPPNQSGNVLPTSQAMTKTFDISDQTSLPFLPFSISLYLGRWPSLRSTISDLATKNAKKQPIQRTNRRPPSMVGGRPSLSKLELAALHSYVRL